ncbi:MAG: PD-(D/E)XK nuclease family protein [Bacteroidales bacterium]|nr:PD-(D/E)XK nuclease family protein [Bacteroidales bacterium]
MESFIDSVTRYLNGHIDDLQTLEIIVPNNRTGSAILDSLKRTATKVCWAPKLTPIKDIFYRGTEIQDAESVILVHYLYKAYCDVFGPTDFDKFYPLGEVLLSDFDDIDKYLIEPDQLFKNITDEIEIDLKFSDYDEEHKKLFEILKNFWTNIPKPKDSKLKTLELWQNMPAIYKNFTAELCKKGLGYQGLIYRQFVEHKINDTKFEHKNYAFVGFSALNKCEKILMKHIREVAIAKGGDCMFFWDADKYYINEHDGKPNVQEAGLFLRNNIKNFPPPKGFEITDTIKDIKDKDIKIIEVPSSVAQVKLVPKLLEEYEKAEGKTAIILGDEKLLVPLIYSLPPIKHKDDDKTGKAYNITMGYPLSYTASSSFAQAIMKLAMHRSTKQENTFVRKQDVYTILTNNFTRKYADKDVLNTILKLLATQKIEYINFSKLKENVDKDEMLKAIFSIETMNESFPKYVICACNYVYDRLLKDDGASTESDFMHRIIAIYTSFMNAVEKEIKFENDKMYQKLMVSLIKQNSLAFDSKTDEPIQILGFMETRSIDFDNTIMLSMNEDTFPKSSYKQSMIPYRLRKAYEMTSIEFQDSIFAYYFYRLLQRCNKVRMLYSTEGKISKGEKSRFITQIEYELGLYEDKDTPDIKYHITKSYEIRPSKTPAIEIKKSEEALEEIHRQLGFNDPNDDINTQSGAFPSLINTYMQCPVRFYFQYIEHIKEPQGIEEDTSALDFGNLLHKSCQFLYGKYTGKEINKDDFKDIRNNIENAIDFAACQIFNISANDKETLKEAKKNIMIEPLRKYLEKIIDNDEKYAPFLIYDLENDKLHKSNKDSNYTIRYNVGDDTVLLKGIIDRIDLKDGVMRVIDYKTSSIKDNKKTYDENFWDRDDFKSKEALQVLIYSEIMSQVTDYKTQPAIISVTNLNDYHLKYKEANKKADIITYQDSNSLRDDFNANLRGILGEILDENTPFKQANEKNCTYCPYRKICNRDNIKKN